jgi:hypothetical protein
MKPGMLTGALASLAVLVLWAAVGPVAGENSTGRAPTATPIRLFVDDFETYSSRWRVVETPKAGVAHRDGELRFQISSPGVSVWSVPDFAVPLGAYRLDVAATVHAATPDSWFGIVVGYVSDEQFTVVVLRPGGEWQLMRRDGAAWTEVAPESQEAPPGPAFDSALALSLAVNQDAVALTVDGLFLGEIPIDSGESEGVFGLIAQAGKGYLDVSFDNIVVVSEAVSESVRP